MKILLFGEYSGFFNSLKKGLLELDHEVFLASNGDSFKNFPSDYRWDSKNKYVKRISILDNLISLKNIYKKRKSFTGYDIVLIISPYQFSLHPFPNRLVYNFLIKNNKKVYLSGAGNSGIIFDYWINREGDKYQKYMSGYFEETKHPELRKHRFYNNKAMIQWEEEFMSKIDGYIPIWYEYAQPFRQIKNLKKTIRIPIVVEDFEYKPNRPTEKIVFLHGISRACKGGKYILQAFDNLREKYKDEAEFISAGGLPINEYLNLIDRTNVIVDDANSYSIAMNALFSMAKGKVVLGGAEEIANKELEYEHNPVFNITSDVVQIEKTLIYLIENRDQIEKIGLLSRQFVEKYHKSTDIARQYINLWEEDMLTN